MLWRRFSTRSYGAQEVQISAFHYSSIIEAVKEQVLEKREGFLAQEGIDRQQHY